MTTNRVERTAMRSRVSAGLIDQIRARAAR
jgi:hypothetical protein